MFSRLGLIMVAASVLVGCQTNPTKPQKIDDISYRKYETIPCEFNGASIGGPPDFFAGPDYHKCKGRDWKPYKGRVGLTIDVSRGTPIYAIADMKVFSTHNNSGLQRCNHPRAKTLDKCQRPYDDLHVLFTDKFNNIIEYYHLMAEGNQVVKGFGTGECLTPLDWKNPAVRNPNNCGGITKDVFRKGELVGYSGQTGNHPHFSLGVNLSGEDPRYPSVYGRVNPAVAFEWETKPSEDDLIYTLPVLQLNPPLSRDLFPKKSE